MLQLADFQNIQLHKKAYDTLVSKSHTSIEVMQDSGGDRHHGLKITILRTYMPENIAIFSHNSVIGEAAKRAVKEFMEPLIPAMMEAVKTAVEHAEIKAAKELKEDAIGILTIANK